MKTSKLITHIVGLAFILTLSRATAADVSFSDGTFDLTDYTHTGSYASDANSTNTVSQSSTNGDPGFNLLQQAVFATGNGSVADGYANNSFTYNPGTQGAITSIDASSDITINVSLGGNDSSTFFPLIEQGGVTYLGQISGPNFSGTLSYTQIGQTGLLATDFTQYDFTTGSFLSAHPNFSSGAMTFGIGLSSFSSGASESNTVTENVDNLAYTIHSTPEPTGMALAMVGGCGLLALRRRRS